VGGEVVRVTSTGIVCVAAPCPVLQAAPLNRKGAHELAGLDFRDADASQEQIEAAQKNPGGMLLAGKEYTISGPAGQMPGLLVVHLFTQVRPASCYVGGCSAELCTDQPDAVSTCIYKPEFECYRDAICARQADQRCGWTPTSELEACLANPPALE
jgi:hypothetical protein